MGELLQATNTVAGMTTFANLDHLHREYHHPQQQYQQQPSGPVASSSSSLIVAHHEGYFGHGVHHHDSTDRVAHDDGDNNNNINNSSHETANMAAAGDYMLSHSSATALKPPPLDRLSFADVMQFADFGPKLALNHHHYHHQQLLPAINKAVNHADDEEQLQEEIDPINHNPRNIGRGHYDNNNMDPHVYFLKFPVLGDRPQDSRHEQQEEEVELQQLIHGELGGESYHGQHGAGGGHGSNIFMSAAAAEDVSNNNNNNPANAALVDFQLLGENNNRNIRDLDDHKSPSAAAAINTITTTTAAHDTADPMIAIIKNMSTSSNNNNNVKRKRPRSIKTSEEVESQRMTHIAVERNRRKQMNEHLRVLRSLMPTSYVQRGDQASIIGGAIEFVRELEQLLQCLESQKRRRLYGTADHQAAAAAAGTTAAGGVIIGQQLPPRPLGDVVEDPSSSLQGIQQQHEQQQQQQHPPIFLQLPPMLPPPPYSASGTADLNNPQGHQQQAAKLVVDLDIMSTTGSCMREETAESKSCIADVEVKMLGFDALIKILSRRRPGQLIKVIAALEDLQFNILHTNITTIEQTVLYSFNVKVASESVFTAEEIASSVQHIFTFIHANTNTA